MTNPAQKIIQAGFALRVVGDKIAITPVGENPINDKLRSYVKANRAAIVAHLLTVPTVPCVATRSRQDVPAPLGEATTTPTTAKATDAAYWPWELADLRGGQP